MFEVEEKKKKVYAALREAEIENMFTERKDGNLIVFTGVEKLHQGHCDLFLMIDDSMFSSITIIFAELPNLNKKEKVLELINELNLGYKANQFFLSDENSIGVKVPVISTFENFDANIFMPILFDLFRLVKDDVYPKFMRIIW